MTQQSANTNMGGNGQKKIGAVLVQGGGIAGVQASLDLANSGFKVYLVEREAAIGGMMSHLDKTFPTGDCATCIVSPKLVECARNLNIEILTMSELTDLKGEPGNFKATVKRYPRYVDETKCNGCSECTNACPVQIPDHFDRELGKRKAIAKHYAQATPNIFGILKNGHAPCKVACPANVNVQGYVQLIKKKEYIKAVNLMRERNPLSAICGRICTHPCESQCTRGNADDSIAIRLLKRFASDQEMRMLESGTLSLPPEKKPAAGAKKVAVVGAGPAGLTVASDLADKGFAVTAYEAQPAAGGMLRYGIPEYRLPKKVLDHEVELIRRKGVRFIFNCRIGDKTTLDQLRKDHDAVFIGAGVTKGRLLGVEGENKTGVLQGVDFLRDVARASRPCTPRSEGVSPSNRGLDARDMEEPLPEVKARVVVIGGGNVAVDVARTALRLGARTVEMVSLEQRHEMPAYPEEVEATLQEGIKVTNGWGPRRILGNGSVTGIELKKCTQVFDADGRFNPIYDEQQQIFIEADQIITAIGQTSDDEFVKHIGAATQGRYFKADPVTLVTSLDGVFAGGDAVSGPKSVIEAVAAGKRAAESIERSLAGKDMVSQRFDATVKPVPEELLPAIDGVEEKPRAKAGELPMTQRIGSFKEVETGLTEEQALAEAERCLNCALCSECKECVEACKQNAIDHLMGERMVELEVGAVILTTGFEEFDASRKGEFGWGRYPNVITSVQFERMLSAAGPFEGHVVRLSDHCEARKIAWIQCVGSRDSKCGNEYCSSICCMASTKQAMVAQDHTPGLEATIFYMDIRAHGKDFDQYYERAKNQNGVRYIKSIPSRIVQMPGTMNPRARFMDETGKLREEEFDLVVLAVGLEPSRSAQQCAQKLGIELNEYGFCATQRSLPLSTSRPGVFVGGAFQEPKDIPETVMQASGAASMAMELLASARNTRTVKKKYPDEHDVTDEEPRIGVFICHCGRNIASVVDVECVVKNIENEPGVVFATHTMFTCADTSLSNIREQIVEHRLNRIVVASCTPRTHEPLFRETLREAGLNPFLFEMANIRDQCSWVHSASPERATQKATELAKMAIARSHCLVPLEGGTLAVDQKGLVIGGGLAGMTAALALANQGFKVHLVERTQRLGGHLHDIHHTLEDTDVAGLTARLIKQVQEHKNINLYLGMDVAEIKGHIGEFHATLSCDGRKSEVSAGAVIVATGAEKAQTTKFLAGSSPNVTTQVDLEKQIHEGHLPAGLQNVVMIQCAGSRDEERPYCSRVCCSMAVKNALAIKAKSPQTDVFVLYRDIRTYGFREIYYKKAREAGVVFLRYAREQAPVVSITGILPVGSMGVSPMTMQRLHGQGARDTHGRDAPATETPRDATTNASGLKVSVNSPDFAEPIEIETDLVVLSTGIEADRQNNKRVSDMLKVPLNADGFYVEAHMKLRPVDFATEGIFLCGLAHSPKFIDETIAQARAAAARAATVLSKTQLDVSPQVSYVDQTKCISCMTCVHVCPYSAPFCNTDGKGQIEAAKCMGCGICASECPARAIQLNHFETDQFRAMIRAILAEGNGASKERASVKVS
ncbi:MAG: FAD-dependent oxidoreductase [Sedimentisphaerales bacterium]|nr:FAD-dependent oxidoreductase [Sedimentisphaerales bacterium]